MKKLFFFIQLTAAAVLFTSAAYAHDGGYRGRDHGWRHHDHHHKHYYPRPKVYNFYSQPQVHYHPQPQVHYYPQPQVHYYPQHQAHYYPQQTYRQSYQDPRSTQGLAGGVIGSVFGYQMGSGDPVITGLGAAAGSYLGNGMSGR